MLCMYTPQFMYAAMDIAVYMNWGAYIHTINELTKSTIYLKHICTIHIFIQYLELTESNIGIAR